MIETKSFTALLDKSFDRYFVLGIVLIVFGLFFALFSYIFTINTSLIALGIASTMLGVVDILTTDLVVPPDVIKISIEKSFAQLEPQLSKFDLDGKAIYRLSGNGVSVLIPIKRRSGLVSTQQVYASSRIFVEDGKLMLITTPFTSGSIDFDSLSDVNDLQEAVSNVLVDILESVKSVDVTKYDDTIVVHMFGSKKTKSNYPRCREALGSLQTMVVGYLLSYFFKNSIYLVEETESEGIMSSVFEVR